MRYLLIMGLLYWIISKFTKKTEPQNRLSILAGEPEIRMDAMGSGRFGAPRRNRVHRGLDLIVQEGDSIFAPVDGFLVRVARPYEGDVYTGFVYKFKNPVTYNGQKVDSIKVFYAKPFQGLMGTEVMKDEKIAVAQKISTKYGGAMKDHVHIEVYYKDELMNPEKTFL